jgi:hypothetical protein
MSKRRSTEEAVYQAMRRRDRDRSAKALVLLMFVALICAGAAFLSGQPAQRTNGAPVVRTSQP